MKGELMATRTSRLSFIFGLAEAESWSLTIRESTFLKQAKCEDALRQSARRKTSRPETQVFGDESIFESAERRPSSSFWLSAISFEPSAARRMANRWERAAS